MHSLSSLVLYIEPLTSFADDVRSLIYECDTPFKEIGSISQISLHINNPNTYIIILIQTIEHFNIIKNIMGQSINRHNIFIVHSCDVENNENLNNLYYFEKLCVLKSALLYNLTIQHSSVYTQTHSLIYKIIRAELEYLEISKKYAGFKYLVDFCVNSICNPILSYTEVIETVSKINTSQPDIVEHAIRHMLLATLKNSSIFRKTLCLKKKTYLNNKEMLNIVLKHIKTLI